MPPGPGNYETLTHAELLACGYAARKARDIEAALVWFGRAAAAAGADPRARIEMAAELLALGRVGPAETLYVDLRTKHPTLREALYGLGLCARQSRDRKAALAHFEAAAAAHPNDVPIQLEIAFELRALGRIQEAETVYHGVLTKQPDQLQALHGLGNCARARGARAEALEHFRAAARAHPHDIWARMEAAAELRELGCLDEAETDYQAVLKTHPAQLQALMGLGYCARRRGNSDQALAHFQASSEARPDYIWAELEIAAELRTLGRVEEAANRYQAILANEPKQPQALHGLASCARQCGDRNAALAHFEAAAAAHPDDIPIQLEIAVELRALGRIQDAETAYHGVLMKQPGQLQALHGLGNCARVRGARAEALEHFRAAARAHPHDIWARMEAAAELRELGCLDEAEANYRAVLENHPGQLQALLGLGLCGRRRGDHAAAERLFGQAMDTNPHDASARLELASVLRDRGEFEAAIAMCEAVLARQPENGTAWLTIGHIHRSSGHLDSALQAFQRATALQPALLHSRLEIARILRELGHHKESGRLLHEARDSAPRSSQVLHELGQHYRLADDLEEAEAFFQCALEADASAIGAAFGLSQTQLELGKPAEALLTLTRLAEAIPSRPEITAKKVAILRQVGLTDQALPLAISASAEAPGHFWLWQQRAELQMLTGNFEGAQQSLLEPPATTTHEKAIAVQLRGMFSELQWDFDTAIAHYRQAQELNPRCWPACQSLTRTLMLNLDVAGAREQLLRLAELDKPTALATGRSSNPSQSLLGQILDEYVLDDIALRAMTEIGKLAPAERIEPLRALIKRSPDYTPAAISWLIALRQAQQLLAVPTPSVSAGVRRILPNIVQYWDSPKLPTDLRALTESWSARNPGWAYTLFDDTSAQHFLRSYSPDVLHAYRRAAEPAQKADIFRLAWLYAVGGYYADADDRALRPIEGFVPSAATLALYQEDICSIGNNFIGAAPQHVIIGRALDLAVDAVNRGDRDSIWLATGPGLLTRAFAQVVCGSRLDYTVWLDNVSVLGRTQYLRMATPHCVTGYKKTSRHWSRATQKKLPTQRSKR